MLKITKEQFYEACLLLNPEMTEEEVRALSLIHI